MMPNHLIFIRHGESEGNIAINAAKIGDNSHFTEAFVNKPDTRWELSPLGISQARAAGEWLNAASLRGEFGEHFMKNRRHYVSPLTRTQKTAGYLGLTQGRYATSPSVLWRKNRSLRERDWGEISTMSKTVYREAYPAAAKKEKMDPLYWRPPGGESIADVAENRVRNFFSTLHRETSGETVFAVTHGEYMRAAHLALTRADDEAYESWDSDKNLKIKNCEIFHYTRVAPEDQFLNAFERLKIGNITTKGLRDKIAFFRRLRPTMQEDGSLIVVEAQPWTEIEFPILDNEALITGHTAEVSL